MVRNLDFYVGYLGWQCRSVARVLPPNPALNTDRRRAPAFQGWTGSSMPYER